jgi:hypothetical protein
VEETTYESLLSVGRILGRIYIGWDTYRVYQHIDILRCFKCNQFGHMVIKCEGAVVVQTVPKIMNQKTAIVEWKNVLIVNTPKRPWRLMWIQTILHTVLNAPRIWRSCNINCSMVNDNEINLNNDTYKKKHSISMR